MAIFKLRKDELIQTWYRDYYEIEAETLEDAKQMILDYDVEPYNSEPLFEFEQEPLETEILTEDGEVIYYGSK